MLIDIALNNLAVNDKNRLELLKKLRILNKCLSLQIQKISGNIYISIF